MIPKRSEDILLIPQQGENVLTMYQSVMNGLSRALARARAPAGDRVHAAAQDTPPVQPITESHALNLDVDREKTKVRVPRANSPGIQREDHS
jgi:hypothetical protein